MNNIGYFCTKNMKNMCWRLSYNSLKFSKRTIGHMSTMKEAIILNKVMQTIEKDSTLHLTSLHLRKPFGYDHNYMSLIQRATVIASRSDETYVQKNFVLKIQLQDEYKKHLFSTEQVWANEEYMYKMIFPAMKTACQSNLYIPKYYYTDSTIMVLEDLRELGYKTVDRVKGLNLDQTLMVVNRLAHFHAASLALQFKENTFYKSVKECHIHPYVTLESQEKTGPLITRAITKAADVLKTDINAKKYMKAISFLHRLAERQAEVVRFLQSLPADDSAVIIHGDLWINNILVKQDSNKKTKDVKFVDFQGSKMGLAVADLHHVLYTSVQGDVRNEHLGNILQYYYDCKINYLRQFVDNSNVKCANTSTFDKLLHDFAKYKLYGLINAILLLSETAVDTKNDRYDPLSMDSINVVNGYRNKLHIVIEEFMQKDWLTFD